MIDIGEHGWRVYKRSETLETIARNLGHPEPEVEHQSVRVRAGHGDEVAHIVINADVNGEAFVSISQERKLRTKPIYRSGRGGFHLHSAEDFRRFMQVMTEAGERAGWS